MGNKLFNLGWPDRRSGIEVFDPRIHGDRTSFSGVAEGDRTPDLQYHKLAL